MDEPKATTTPAMSNRTASRLESLEAQNAELEAELATAYATIEHLSSLLRACRQRDARK